MNDRAAKIIRDQRKRLNLSQEQMAEKMGVTVNYISLIENEKKNPGTAFLGNFAREFNIPVILLAQDNLIPKPTNRKEEEIFSKLKNIMGDLEKLFLSAN